MGRTFRELQQCNNCIKMCKLNQEKEKRRKMNNFLRSIREPQSNVLTLSILIQ